MAIRDYGGEVLPYGTPPPMGGYNYTIAPAPPPQATNSPYVPASDVFKDSQTFGPKVFSTPKFGDLTFDGSEFNSVQTQTIFSDKEFSTADLSKGIPEAAINLNLRINGQGFTFHPSNIIEKGLLVDKKQFYNPKVLQNLDQLYEQGQPISLKGVGWYEDFLNKNNLSTDGVLLPAGELNFNIGSGGNWKVKEIGEVSDKIRFNEISGIGKLGDQYVYTANVDPVDATSAYGYYDATGAKGEWTKEKGGLLGDVSRAVAQVPFLPEVAGAITKNPYVYATLKGLQAGARGEEPIKAGLKAGATILAADLAADFFSGAPAEAAPVGEASGVSGGSGISGEGLSSAEMAALKTGTGYGETAQSLLNQDLQFVGADAAQLYNTTGKLAAVQQNLIAAGVDPIMAAEAANLAAFGGSGASIASGLGAAFPGEAAFTSEGLLSGGSTLDKFAKDIGGGISSTGSAISLSDAFRAANLAQNLMAGQPQQQQLPNQQLPGMQATGVDLLSLPQFAAGVPNIAGLLNPMPYRGPTFDFYTGLPTSLLG